MKKLFIFFAASLVASETAAQPTMISVSAAEVDVTHNSILIKDKANGNGKTYQSHVEYGSIPTALNHSSTPFNRGAGLSDHEEMLVNLTGPGVFYRVVYNESGSSVQTSIFEVALKSASTTYLVVDNLVVKNVNVGANSASATLQAVVKCNGASDTWFEYGESQPLSSTTSYVTKQAGIDTVKITVTGLPKNSSIYFRANSLSGSTVVSAPSISSFSTTSSTGIAEMLKKEFKIYPNPITDKVFVEGEGDIEFFDISGKKVFEGKIEREDDKRDRTEIDCEALASGIYAYRYRAKRDGVEVKLTGKVMKLR